MDNLELSATRSPKTAALYVKMPFGGIFVCTGVFLDVPEGDWLYTSSELPGDILGIDRVTIQYIDKKAQSGWLVVFRDNSVLHPASSALLFPAISKHPDAFRPAYAHN
jgi:hypothetical protein